MRDALREAPWLGTMALVFDRAKQPLYLVGGAVRNPLMGLPLSDVDVCGPARPDEVLALCEGTPVRATLRAAHFGTVELRLTGADGTRHMAEYTTFREDSYRCGHQPDRVRFSKKIAVDALRRDFSVNALYRRVREGSLEPVIDPTGGLDHLKAGVLHTVTADPDRVLKDDGLRILRAARFQAELDLRPTPALLGSLARHAPLLADIACERLRDELRKTLLADLRYPALRRRHPCAASGLATLNDIGAWTRLFGEAPYDGAAARALEGFRTDAPGAELAGRMALLFHKAGPEGTGSIMLRLRFSAADTALSRRYGAALHALAGPVDPFDAVRLGRDAVAYAKSAFSALGDALGASRASALLDSLSAAPWSLKELQISGNELLPLFLKKGIPTRRMGRTLERLWRMAVAGEAENTRPALEKAAECLLGMPS